VGRGDTQITDLTQYALLSSHQSVKVPRATDGQRGGTSQHRLKGQQTLRHEVTQVWGAVTPISNLDTPLSKESTPFPNAS